MTLKFNTPAFIVSCSALLIALTLLVLNHIYSNSLEEYVSKLKQSIKIQEDHLESYARAAYVQGALDTIEDNLIFVYSQDENKIYWIDDLKHQSITLIKKTPPSELPKNLYKLPSCKEINSNSTSIEHPLTDE